MTDELYKRPILLTGAGFTKNFGGLLGSEMWNKIFNNPILDNCPKIKKELRGNFDFEDVYSNVLNNDDYLNERKEFQNVVKESYDDMERPIKNFTSNGILREFMKLFGLVFTLNQDLFLENLTTEEIRFPLGLNGSGSEYQDYREKISSGKKLTPSDTVVLPTEKYIKENEKTFFTNTGGYSYIKLHGSNGWLSFDGNNQLVLGTNKLEDLRKEPLLNWYLDIFEQSIFRDDAKILIVGYGFRDDHINDRLVKSIEQYNTKIYILDPSNPEVLRNKLMYDNPEGIIKASTRNTHHIWNKMSGCFSSTLEEIIPHDGSETHTWLDIKKIFMYEV